MLQREKPILYRFFRWMLIIASGVIIILVIAFVMRFVLNTPFYRMFDDVPVLTIITMALMIPIIICLMIAWLHAIGGGIASLVFVIGYTVIESIQNGMYTATAINYIMVAISILFIIQGIIKK
ncbi:MAG: hypothetical protein KAQ68_10235, partial [Clostridiales bacterium]|nr:hypothetical protein [Clostridiales bacterium]